jgi:hypothetical protein
MSTDTNRRALLQAVLAAGASSPAAFGTPLPASVGLTASTTEYLDVARQVAVWLRKHATPQAVGIAWPIDPDKPEAPALGIYKGNAGILIFFLELARATSDVLYIEDARKAADYLVSEARSLKASDFGAEGLSGAAFSVIQAWKATGDKRYRDSAIALTELVAQRAQPSGSGVTWGRSFYGIRHDISTGDAGIVSYLQYAAQTFGRDDWRQLAVKGGEQLLAIAHRDEAGNAYWGSADSKELANMGIHLEAGQIWSMPNFAHGTGGVATVLAQIYEKTHQEKFLDAALSAGAYLKRIAHIEDGTFLVCHHKPYGNDLFYLGQCNGPAGTARLYYELYRNAHDKSWLDITERSAGAILKYTLPEQPDKLYSQIPARVEFSTKLDHLPGFWNNISQCCGSAGIADFLLGLHHVTGRQQYLDFARRTLDNVISRAFIDETGYRWYQSENRKQPWIVVAQTGYMQGAAGVGSALVHLHLALQGDYQAIAFPYDPFPPAPKWEHRKNEQHRV